MPRTYDELREEEKLYLLNNTLYLLSFNKQLIDSLKTVDGYIDTL